MQDMHRIMRMPRSTTRRARCANIETVFAGVVVLACFLSIIITTITQVSRRTGSTNNVIISVHESKIFINKRDDGEDDFPIKVDTDFSKGTHMQVEDSKETTRADEESEEALRNFPLKPWFTSNRIVKLSDFATKTKNPIFPGYLIENPDYCLKQRVDLLIYFHSSPGRFMARKMLRETWVQRDIFKNIRMKTIFFVGIAPQPIDEPGVRLEFAKHRDLVQGEFLDTYENLAVKSVMVAHWVSEHCPQARYVIKADDDVFIDIFRWVEKLVPQMWSKEKTLMCNYKQNNQIVRGNKRWGVPEHVLPNRTQYPAFCSGFATMITTDLMPIMYEGSYKAPYVQADDAFLFGLTLENRTDIKYMNIQSNLSMSQDLMMKEYVNNQPRKTVATLVHSIEQFPLLWEAAVRNLTDWSLGQISRKIITFREEIV